MKIRDVLLNTYKELRNEVAYAVEVNALLRRVMKRSVDGADIAEEPQAAIREGDPVISSPGMIEARSLQRAVATCDSKLRNRMSTTSDRRNL